MFLVNDKKASDDFEGVADHIRAILERRGATIDTLELWESGRLAYPVEGRTHGAHVLGRFEADPSVISDIKRECRISNIVMRAMILRADEIGTSVEEAREHEKERKRQAAIRAGEIVEDEEEEDDYDEEYDEDEEGEEEEGEEETEEKAEADEEEQSDEPEEENEPEEDDEEGEEPNR